MAFQPGQSGNPGGRPKGEARLREIARESTDKAMAVILEALADEDKRVALKAAEMLLDRGWGKAPQAVTGEGGEGPAEVLVRWMTHKLGDE